MSLLDAIHSISFDNSSGIVSFSNGSGNQNNFDLNTLNTLSINNLHADKVGVNTTNPSCNLEVQGSAYISDAVDIGNNLVVPNITVSTLSASNTYTKTEVDNIIENIDLSQANDFTVNTLTVNSNVNLSTDNGVAINDWFQFERVSSNTGRLILRTEKSTSSSIEELLGIRFRHKNGDEPEVDFAFRGSNFLHLHNDSESSFQHPVLFKTNTQFETSRVRVAKNGEEARITVNGFVNINEGENLSYSSSTNGVCSAINGFKEGSDEILKENFEPVRDAVAKVCQLHGYTFNRKRKIKREIGLIAQDVEKVAPEAVDTLEDEGRIKCLNYGRLSALFVEAIKEQNQHIQRLGKTISEIKNMK